MLLILVVDYCCIKSAEAKVEDQIRAQHSRASKSFSTPVCFSLTRQSYDIILKSSYHPGGYSSSVAMSTGAQHFRSWMIALSVGALTAVGVGTGASLKTDRVMLATLYTHTTLTYFIGATSLCRPTGIGESTTNDCRSRTLDAKQA